MKHKIYLYICLLLTVVLGACQDESYTSTATDLKTDEYRFTMKLPEPVDVTRAMGDQASFTKLNVLVFNEAGVFVARQEATGVTVDNKSPQEVTFTVSLPQSDQPRILHFVGGDVAFGTYSVGDTESSIFSNLVVEGNTDAAYWQRVEVSSIDNTNKEALLKQINGLYLIRNFAKVSVHAASSLDNFQIEGFVVLNNTTAGTVAPYLGKVDQPFADFNLESDDPYAAVAEVQGYVGNRRGELNDAVPATSLFTNEAKYVYERPQVDTDDPAYILVKAHYTDAVNEEESGTYYYYKIDIVRQDPNTKLNTYLNLYRNFFYDMTITAVRGAGYTNPQDAMNSAASNNISASVEVSEVTSIEYDNHRLTVDENDVIWVEKMEHYIGFEYLSSISPREESDNVAVSYEKNDYLTFSIDKTNHRIVATPNGPWPTSMQRIELVLYTTDDTGLSRNITVRLREPFTFNASCIKEIPAEVGAEQTVTITLPEELPNSAFPLEFYIEPIDKTIYPDASQNSLPVRLHENSSFDYVATITQAQYEDSRTFEFHFLSNVAESATQIKVSSDLFAEHDVLSFINPSISNISLKLTDGTSVGSIDGQGAAGYVPYEAGTTVILEFDAPGDEPFTLDMDYLELVEDSRNTGSCRPTNNGYTYTPNSGTAHHVLVFKTKYDIVSETIRVESNSCNPVSISYSNEPRSYDLTLKYGGAAENISSEDVTIEVGTKTNEVRTERNGKVTINLNDYIGSNLDAEVTFKYVRSFIVWSTTYSYSTTLRELRNNATYTLTER